MAEILVRGLEKRVVDRLKSRAKRYGRSLQGEAKCILEQAAGLGEIESTLQGLREHRTRLGRRFRKSEDLIRQDRGR